MEMKKNKWKIAFISLITSLVVLVFAFFIFVLYYLPVPIEHSKYEIDQHSGDTRFIITTTRENLQLFIDEQLSKEESDNFQIYLSEYVTFTADIPFLGSQIPLQLDLEPQLYGDGNLLLTERAFRIGQLHLPSDTLFQLISRMIEFPEWIKIDAKEGNIYLYINNIETLNNLYMKVTAFDLEKNEIEFELVSK